jgi:hypothetical protein
MIKPYNFGRLLSQSSWDIDALNDREAHMAKKFYRSKKDRVIAGVCRGIAEYFDFDPIIVRLTALSLVLSAAEES